MQIKYTYNGKDYSSEWEVRQAIWEHEYKAFGDAPKDEAEKAAFWQQFSVTMTQVETPFEDLKAQKSYELEQAFLAWYNSGAYLISSLGFTADSDSRANTDVKGLILTADSGQAKSDIIFMDHDNTPRHITIDQLKTLELEIALNGQSAYQQKWQLRQAIEAATDQEALDAIKIEFTPTDFSKAAA